MKSCPDCRRVYPEDAGFCPVDGSALKPIADVAVEAEKDPRLGRRLGGRYELRRIVADGAMGRVYEGVDTELQRRTAIKVLHPQIARDEVSLERFKREYEVSAQLPHEHIIDMLDFQEDAEAKCHFLVMEFLDGEELSVVLKRDTTLSPARLVRLMAQIAVGLDEAHKRHFIHRDLKPDNLFLCGTRDGDIVKILDFGSVKDKNKQSKKLTVMGTTIGTPYYMAPEQAQGLESLDGRADVFALGAIAYECLTGQIAFNGRTGPEILVAIMTKEPKPVRDLAPELPEKVEFVLEEALVKNPGIRTKSCGAFADALGHSFGLSGNHAEWAKATEKAIEDELEEARKKRPSLTPSALAADPFASGAPVAVGDPFAGSGPAPKAAASSMDDAFAATREAEFEASLAASVPQGGAPKWLIPAIVGVVLVVGGIVAALKIL
jgi:serine/threonine-protein kinase